METLFQKLTEVLSKYQTIIIMSHQNPDLDAIGSSMGLSQILTEMGKKSYILLHTKDKKEYNSSVQQALEKVHTVEFLYPETLSKKIGEDTVLIVLDVHQKERVEYPEIFDLVSNVIVLDHHIKSNSYIKDTELFYIDSTMSSMVELISHYAKYCGVNLSVIVSTIMLAGMEIDTNGFNLKTTEKTFEVAAFLTSMGADSVLKQTLLKESKDEFLRRAEVAEELLNFEYIEATFAIGQLNENTVGVSARSMGDINVCDVMKAMGGGGHITNAACEVQDKTVKEVERKLKNILGELL